MKKKFLIILALLSLTILEAKDKENVNEYTSILVETIENILPYTNRYFDITNVSHMDNNIFLSVKLNQENIENSLHKKMDRAFFKKSKKYLFKGLKEIFLENSCFNQNINSILNKNISLKYEINNNSQHIGTIYIDKNICKVYIQNLKEGPLNE